MLRLDLKLNDVSTYELAYLNCQTLDITIRLWSGQALKPSPAPIRPKKVPIRLRYMLISLIHGCYSKKFIILKLY